ncbi:MAG: hypothetical protein ACPHCN_08410 [Mycobacterium sp.]
MSFPICHTDPLDANDASAKATPGMLYSFKGDIYRYGQFKDAVTYVAGHVLTFAAADATAFTNDRSGGSSVGNAPAGVAVRVMTQDYYGYSLVNGYYSAVVTNGDDDIAAGVPLIVATGADGACDSAADPNPSLHFGDSLAADDNAADTVAAIVRCM